MRGYFGKTVEKGIVTPMSHFPCRLCFLLRFGDQIFLASSLLSMGDYCTLLSLYHCFLFDMHHCYHFLPTICEYKNVVLFYLILINLVFRYIFVFVLLAGLCITKGASIYGPEEAILCDAKCIDQLFSPLFQHFPSINLGFLVSVATVISDQLLCEC